MAAGEQAHAGADGEQAERGERDRGGEWGAVAEQERQQGQRCAGGEGGERRACRHPGRTQLVGVEAEFFAREGIERAFGVLHQGVGQPPRLGSPSRLSCQAQHI